MTVLLKKLLLLSVLFTLLTPPVWASPSDDLIKAVKLGQLEGLKSALKKGASIKALYKKEPLIFLAIDQGHLNIVQYLIEKKLVDINSKNREGLTLLSYANLNIQDAIVKYLAEQGANLHVKTLDGTILHQAASSGSDWLINFAVGKGFDVNQRSESITPLMIASMLGHLSTVKLLVKLGADIHLIEDDQGFNALMSASYMGYTSVARYLRKAGGQFNAKNSYGVTELHIASASGDLQWTKQALKVKSQLKATDKNGFTPLALASLSENNTSVVNYLREQGAALAANTTKEVELYYAASSGDIQWVQEVLSRSVKLNQTKPSGTTPLMQAAKFGHLKIVKLLLKKGANPTFKNRSGKQALDFAKEYVHPDIVKLLETLRKE